LAIDVNCSDPAKTAGPVDRGRAVFLLPVEQSGSAASRRRALAWICRIFAVAFLNDAMHLENLDKQLSAAESTVAAAPQSHASAQSPCRAPRPDIVAGFSPSIAIL